MKKQNGITLIALVITIIILLILAGVSISMVVGNNGIATKASSASEKTKETSEEEELKLAVQPYVIDKYTESIELIDVLKEKYKEESLLENGDSSVTVTMESGNRYKVTTDGKVKKLNGVSAVEIFDQNGMNKDDANYKLDKLHIGDFVTYDAGSWTLDEINSIQVGKVGSLISPIAENDGTLFRFSRIAENGSRNTHKQIDTEKAQGSDGWRVFDIDETTGKLTLISAGTPESYYHKVEQGGEGYLSEYVLSGNINANAPTTVNGDNYVARNYDVYVNENQNAISAKVLTKDLLEDWFENNVGLEGTELGYGENNADFLNILNTQYETLISTPESYALAQTHATEKNVIYSYYGSANRLDATSWQEIGIRILVELDGGAELSKAPIETKMVTNKNGESVEYNVWKLYEN